MFLFFAILWVCFRVIQPQGYGGPVNETINRGSRHPCDRPCQEWQNPMICEYKFVVELQVTMSPRFCKSCPRIREDCYLPGCIAADGGFRTVLAVNNQMPGPPIRVCENDIIVVNVINNLKSQEAISIHWHGIHHVETPFMDGVAYVTQCPIAYGSSFRYKFKAYPPGTTFWHAHSGFLREDGVAGELIIRERRGFKPKIPFDLDQNAAIMLADWAPKRILPYFGPQGGDSDPPPTLLLNGRNGILPKSPPFFTVFPRTRFYGSAPYTIRVIYNGFMFCPVSLNVDGHNLRIVKGDGYPVAGVEVGTLIFHAAERYDIQLIPNKWAKERIARHTDYSLFKLNWEGFGECKEDGVTARGESFLVYTDYEVSVSNLLDRIKQYNSQKIIPKPTNNLIYNPSFLPDYSTNSNYVKTSDLRSTMDDELNLEYVDHKFYLFVDSAVGNPTPNINNITFDPPPAPLLTQFEDVDSSLFCNVETTHAHCLNGSQKCKCIQMYDIQFGDVIEFVVVDEGRNGRFNIHSFHLHGTAFAVLSQVRLSNNISLEEVKELDHEGELERNLKNPPLKDVFTVPEGGYGVIRFKADNPGFWLFHCHLGFHLIGGRTIALKIGTLDQMVKAPKTFPQCHPFTEDFDLPY